MNSMIRLACTNILSIFAVPVIIYKKLYFDFHQALEEKLSQQDEALLVNEKCQKELSKFREMERDNQRLKDENRLLRLI